MADKFHSVSDIRAKLLSHEWSVKDVYELFLKAEKEHRHLNAVLEVYGDMDDAIASAQARIDTEGEKSPYLCGIPIVVKDNICIEGRTASAGSKILENYIAPYDATVISKLKKDNALLVARANMDEFAMGGSGENSAYGATKNPHDNARVSGGSSSGSASAVAGSITPLALGSDTGGSIRQPAAFCGIVGLKPSYGAVSRYGLMAMGSSLDQIGPLGHTVADVEALFSVIKGRDDKDATSREFENNTAPIKTLGVPRHLFDGVDKDLMSVFDATIERLKGEGYDIVDVELPHASYGIATYYVLMPAEASTNLARYDGVRFGLKEEGDTVLDGYINTRTKGFGKEVRRRILLGTYVLSSGYIDAYYYKAEKVRERITKEHEDVLKRVDAIILPTTPTPAFKIGEKEDPVSMYLADIFTVNANLTGLPALSVPMGVVSKDGKDLPVGIQIMGRMGSEHQICEVGKKITQE